MRIKRSLVPPCQIFAGSHDVDDDDSDCCGRGPRQQWRHRASRRPQEGPVVRFCSSDDFSLFTCTFLCCVADAVTSNSGPFLAADPQGVFYQKTVFGAFKVCKSTFQGGQSCFLFREKMTVAKWWGLPPCFAPGVACTGLISCWVHRWEPCCSPSAVTLSMFISWLSLCHAALQERLSASR